MNEPRKKLAGHHRSPLTKAQRRALKQIKRDGCAMREVVDGQESWRSIMGHRYNRRTLRCLLAKGFLASGNDGMFGIPQTMIPL
jgi:hypothetical protein